MKIYICMCNFSFAYICILYILYTRYLRLYTIYFRIDTPHDTPYKGCRTTTEPLKELWLVDGSESKCRFQEADLMPDLDALLTSAATLPPASASDPSFSPAEAYPNLEPQPLSYLSSAAGLAAWPRSIRVHNKHAD